jgi:hypothetical protein
MAAPEITLQYPYVLIVPGSSPLDGVAQGSAILFGQLAMVNAMCDSFAADDYVMYLSTGSIMVSYDSIEYALVDQKNVFYREDYVTPP